MFLQPKANDGDAKRRYAEELRAQMAQKKDRDNASRQNRFGVAPAPAAGPSGLGLGGAQGPSQRYAPRAREEQNDGSVLPSYRNMGGIVPRGGVYRHDAPITTSILGGLNMDPPRDQARDVKPQYGRRAFIDDAAPSNRAPAAAGYGAPAPQQSSYQPSWAKGPGTPPGFGWKREQQMQQPQSFRGPEPGVNPARQSKEDYAAELRRQMQEKQEAKVRDKHNQARWEQAKEQEAALYNPFGRGGGGAPLRDANGNVMTVLRGQGITTEQSSPPRIAAIDPYGRRDGGHAGLNPPPQPVQAGGGAISARYVGDKPPMGGHAAGGIGFDPVLDNRNKEVQYRQELLQQAEMDKRRKEQEKVRLAQLEARDEANAVGYNPFGRGGAGAPLRDAAGNIIANIRGMGITGNSPEKLKHMDQAVIEAVAKQNAMQVHKEALLQQINEKKEREQREKARLAELDRREEERLRSDVSHAWGNTAKENRPVLGGERPAPMAALTRGLPLDIPKQHNYEPPKHQPLTAPGNVSHRRDDNRGPPAAAPAYGRRRAPSPEHYAKESARRAGLGVLLDPKPAVLEPIRYKAVGARGSSVLDDLGRLRSELKAEQARVRSQVERQAAVVESIRRDVDMAVGEHEGAAEELRQYRDQILKGNNLDNLPSARLEAEANFVFPEDAKKYNGLSNEDDVLSPAKIEKPVVMDVHNVMQKQVDKLQNLRRFTEEEMLQENSAVDDALSRFMNAREPQNVVRSSSPLEMLASTSFVGA